MLDKMITDYMNNPNLKSANDLMMMINEKRNELQNLPKKVQVVNKSNNPLPEYSTIGSAGMDVRAYITKEYMQRYSGEFVREVYGDFFIRLAPGERALIPTGLYFKLPEGYEMQIRPRSGLALKNGITIVNTPGTLDSDYLGELGVILINHGKENFTIDNGDRIAQIVINKYEKVEFESVDDLGKTDRDTGGFGSTGVK